MEYHGPDALEGSHDPVTFTISRRESWPINDAEYVGGGFDCSEWMYWYRASGPFDAQPGETVLVVPAKDMHFGN